MHPLVFEKSAITDEKVSTFTKPLEDDATGAVGAIVAVETGVA